MEQETIIAVSVLGGALALTLVLVAVMFSQLSSVRRTLRQMSERNGLRVQKLTLDDKNHAFHNPAISPDEELARRGFSMYAAGSRPDDDVESGRGTERQTGGQFVEDLAREIDSRQQRRQMDMQPVREMEKQDRQPTRQSQPSQPQSQWQQPQPQSQWQQPQPSPQPQPQSQWQPPPDQPRMPSFLLQSIEDSKKRTRNLANPVANGGRQSDTNPNFIY